MRHDKPRFKGLASAEGQIDVLTNKIINLGAPTAGTDAARLQDVTDAAANAQFYGNTVKHTDGTVSFSGVTVFNFNSSHFYLHQNAPNTDEVVINLRDGIAVTDHGALGGLGDDDHSQYILVAGTRAFTGDQSMGTNRLTNLGAPVDPLDAARLVDIPGFYQTVKLTDDSASFTGIRVTAFNSDDFYIHQNAPNTDEAIVSLRVSAGDGLQKSAISFASSVEWVMNHNLGKADLVWSTYDDATEAMIPSRADISDPNTAYFYWAEAVAGRAVVVG